MARHWCQLNVSLAVETAAIQTKPACAGYKNLDFGLVRVGGLGFCSRDFQSPELKLTPMMARKPLQMAVQQAICVSPAINDWAN